MKIQIGHAIFIFIKLRLFIELLNKTTKRTTSTKVITSCIIAHLILLILSDSNLQHTKITTHTKNVFVINKNKMGN